MKNVVKRIIVAAVVLVSALCVLAAAAIWADGPVENNVLFSRAAEMAEEDSAQADKIPLDPPTNTRFWYLDLKEDGVEVTQTRPFTHAREIRWVHHRQPILLQPEFKGGARLYRVELQPDQKPVLKEDVPAYDETGAAILVLRQGAIIMTIEK